MLQPTPSVSVSGSRHELIVSLFKVLDAFTPIFDTLFIGKLLPSLTVFGCGGKKQVFYLIRESIKIQKHGGANISLEMANHSRLCLCFFSKSFDIVYDRYIDMI